MNFEDIKTICVVGAGNMGHQIAVCSISPTILPWNVIKQVVTRRINPHRWL